MRKVSLGVAAGLSAVGLGAGAAVFKPDIEHVLRQSINMNTELASAMDISGYSSSSLRLGPDRSFDLQLGFKGEQEECEGHYSLDSSILSIIGYGRKVKVGDYVCAISFFSPNTEKPPADTSSKVNKT